MRENCPSASTHRPVSLNPTLVASLIILLFWGTVSLSAQPAPLPARQFPPGSIRSVQDLPLSRFRSDLERLPLRAQAQALAWLNRFHFTSGDLASLQVDRDGGVFYADEFEIPAVKSPQTSEPAIAAASVPVSPFPAGLKFHSRPGAPNVIYLDFDGENVTGTQWNTDRTVIPAVPFSTDSDYANYSDTEQTAIRLMWFRISEDYAPFNVDVTTERPATFTTRTAHVLITRNTDTNGVNNPSSTAGGVAYVDVFGLANYASYRPAWVYFNNLAYDESYIAEAASHEAGHNMGLSHDGTSSTGYYSGHGSGDTSWGPIMGTGYDRNVSQWSKGEYYDANNTEDDLAIIVGKLSNRTDDHGNTNSSATALVLTGTNILSTTPATDPTNTNKANKGVIERTTDIDVFSFSTLGGLVTLNVAPWIMPSGSRTRGGNLDVLLELYNASGAKLLTNNPATTTTASLQTNLAAGTYYLYVRNTGYGAPTNSSPYGYTAYGSLGQYFISGSIASTQVVVQPTIVYNTTLDLDPGWTLDPDWQFGVPNEAGIGLTSGYTGANVIGYNLSGNYASRISPVRYATTPAIDCTDATGLTLRFQRWLGLNSGDTATIEISTNGTTWDPLWAAPGVTTDNGWNLQELALPSSYDGAAALRIRWGLGSNPNQQDTGWNLDDIQVTAAQVQHIASVNVVTAANPPSQGTVTPLSGSFSAGTSVQFTATPATYYAFSNWTGGVTSTVNPLFLVVTNSVTLTANFRELLTSNTGTPYWWLAAYGITNNFDQAATNYGANGMRYWESYIAGLVPTNPASQLLLSAQSDPAGLVLQWSTVTGRVYSLVYGSNLLQPLAPVPGAANLPASVTRYTNAPATPAAYYRLRVALP